jgi:hypothetical protein
MTTNVTRFMIDLGEMALGRDPNEVARARRRAKHTWAADRRLYHRLRPRCSV